MQSTTGNPMYALRDVPGKGKGLVTIEKISKEHANSFRRACRYSTLQ